MFKITKNNNIDMITKGGRFIQSVDNFKKDIKSLSSGRMPSFIGQVYSNTDDKLKKIIEKQVLKKAKKINVGGKVYDVSKQLKRTFKINKDKYNELVLKSSLRIPVFVVDSDTKDIQTINISDKPLLYNTFGIDTRNELVKVFTGDIDMINDNKFNFSIDNVKTKYTVNVKFDVEFSSGYERRSINIPIDDKPTNLNKPDYIKNKYINPRVITKYKNSGALQFKNMSYEVISSFKQAKRNISGAVMLKQKDIININNIYNNIINIENSGVCVYTYISKLWKSRKFKNLDLLKTPNDLYKFCVEKKIKTICYDITGKIINSNYVESKIKALIYICFNNHIYPLKNTYLEKNTIQYTIKVIDNINEIINNSLNNNILPGNIKINDDNNIISCTINDIKYIDNKEYAACKTILDIYGLSDRLYDTIKLSKLADIISPLYITENINSFMPIKYIKEPYIYNNKKVKYTDTTTIDKNKCYSHALYNLNFLITTDIRCNPINDYIMLDDDLKFIEHYLYQATPDQPNLLMPNNDLYSGLFLNYCKDEGIKFTVDKTIICNMVDNQYKQMIIDIYSKLQNVNITLDYEPINIAKYIINIMIGKFNVSLSTYISKTNSIIIPNTDLEFYEGNIFVINDNYSIVYDSVETIGNIYNKMPIDIQIKDESRKILYTKMKDLNINNDEVIQVKTDSITINKKITIRESGHWTGWKYEEYKPITATKPSRKHIDYTDLYNKYDATLYDCYAGAGKSTHIMKTYKTMDNYIILTPSHSSNKQYKKNGYSCDVIQKYEYSGEIPKQNIIIVDEIGMVSKRGWDLIYKSAYMGKIIKLYGDFKQLSPIDNNIYNTDIWRKLFYKDIKMITTNYRNNNTITYYDNIINGNIKYNDVKHLNTTDSDNVVVYRNTTRIEYNNLICERKGIHNLYDVGNRIICVDNKLRQHNIFNGFVYTVKETYKDYIITDDNTKITKKQLLHFDYAWARTIYKLQGETLNNIYIAHEDKHFYTNNILYTIISRLKADLTPASQSRNNSYNHLWN